MVNIDNFTKVGGVPALADLMWHHSSDSTVLQRGYRTLICVFGNSVSLLLLSLLFSVVLFVPRFLFLRPFLFRRLSLEQCKLGCPSSRTGAWQSPWTA